MGIVYFGIPEKTTIFLKEILNLNIFVEGGTYFGFTAKKMSAIFEKVFTIEKSEIIFEKAKEKLNTHNNVILLKGDTREYLDNILKDNDNILFWLDSHWSGGDTYGKDDECPLIKELEVIFKYKKNYVILIDDARLFLAPPPLPHNFKNWPDIKDIINIIPNDFDIIILEDVIYLFSHNISEKFKNFIQIYVTQIWEKGSKNSKKIINNIKGIIKHVFKK